MTVTTHGVYFAGALFDIRQLQGNAAIAEAVVRLSQGRFHVTLPQNVEVREFNPQLIRDEDYLHLISSNLCIIQFDGLELDAGTVAEFCMAKMADIPTLILRTDFRSSGDQGDKGDPWNLMLSFFPRTEVLCVNSMGMYKEELAKTEDKTTKHSLAASAKVIEALAQQVIEKLEKLIQEPPLMPKELQSHVYQWLMQLPGYKEPEKAKQLIERALKGKQAAGLL